MLVFCCFVLTVCLPVCLSLASFLKKKTIDPFILTVARVRKGKGGGG